MFHGSNLDEELRREEHLKIGQFSWGVLADFGRSGTNAWQELKEDPEEQGRGGRL